MIRKYLLGAVLASIVTGAAAQADYPSRLVTVIFPYTPATTGDTEVRELAAHLQKVLGQPFVMDYKPGASGTIAVQQAMRAAPDGYTLVIGTTTTLLTGPMLMPERSQYVTTFEPVSALFRGFSTLDVPGSSKNKTLRDLIVDIQAHPGKITFGSIGPGSLSHLSAESFLKLAGDLKATHIPYRGPPQAQLALMTGEVDFLFESAPTALPQIKAGKIRALGVIGDQRAPLLPEVPSLTESGVPVVSGLWYGLFAPKGTPRAIVEKLSAAVNDHFRQQQTVSTLASRGLVPLAGTPDELQQRLTGDSAKWTGLIKSLNLP